MPIRLKFSNQTEELSLAFQNELRSRWVDPFHPPGVIVQNRLVEKWIQLQWAERFGVVAGFESLFLEQWLWSLVASPQQKMLRSDHLQIAILDVLRGTQLPTAVENYLQGQDQVAIARKRVQLSQRLAGLFLEYQSNRPLILENGKVTRRGFGFDPHLFTAEIRDADRKKQALEYEEWQEWIFAEARKRCHADYITLPELWLQCWELIAQLDPVRALRDQAHAPILFGTSGLSLFHRHCLVQLADPRQWGGGLDLSVYLLNPCAEFWDDVVTDSEKSRRNRAKAYFQKSWSTIASAEPGDLWKDQQQDHRLLELWGQAGRDNIALWCQSVDYDLDFIQVESPGQNLLHAIQDSLRLRQARLEWKGPEQGDSSISILAVPGLRREVEILQERVLYLLTQDPQLKLHDIGVFCPDPEKYRPVFAEVFAVVPSDSSYYVPFEFTEQSAGTSLYSTGLESLLALTDQQWTRTQVFALLRNPLIQKARHYSADQESDWESWTESLNTYRGWDQGEHSWVRAIQRLLISDLATHAAVLGSVDATDPHQWISPWSDLSSRDSDSRFLFIQCLEDLHQDLQTLGPLSTATWKDWATRIQTLLNTWFDIPIDVPGGPSYGAERVVRSQIFKELDQLSLFDSTCTWSEFRLLLESRLDHELPQKGSVLGGKLMVCTLREARPLPWKHAFVLGMQAGDFPPRDREDRLDLRWWKPIPGDSTPRRSMQFAFLELITCVRQSLTLSYQCEDLSKGSPILPSSTLLEFQRYLEDSGIKILEQKVSLLAEEDPSPQVILPHVQALRQVKPTPPPEQTAPLFTKAVEKGFSFKALQDFLINPIEYTLKHELRIYTEEESDAMANSDIPLSWDSLQSWKVLDRWLKLLVQQIFVDSRVPSYTLKDFHLLAQQTWIQTKNQLIAEGISPEGLLKSIAEEKIQESLDSFEAQLFALVQYCADWSIQNDYCLAGQPGLLEGSTPQFILLESSDKAESIFVHANASKTDKGFKHLSEPYAFALWRAAQGYSTTCIALVRKQEFKSFENLIVHWNFTQEDAKIIIEQMLQDAKQSSAAFDMIPLDSIKVNAKNPDDISIKELEPEKYKIEIMRILLPQIPEDYLDKIRKRYALLIHGGSHD